MNDMEAMKTQHTSCKQHKTENDPAWNNHPGAAMSCPVNEDKPLIEPEGAQGYVNESYFNVIKMHHHYYHF
jgi:hypothetical protein